MRLRCTAKVARLFSMSKNVEEMDQDDFLEQEKGDGNAINVIKEARNGGNKMRIFTTIFQSFSFVYILFFCLLFQPVAN